MKRLGKFAAHEQSKISVFTVQLGIAIAMTINSNDTIRIFGHYIAIRVHTEGTHHIVIGLGAIQNFSLINLISDMLEHIRRHLHPHTDIHLIIDKRKP